MGSFGKNRKNDPPQSIHCMDHQRESNNVLVLRRTAGWGMANIILE
jgi:hypothetical protein